MEHRKINISSIKKISTFIAIIGLIFACETSKNINEGQHEPNDSEEEATTTKKGNIP